MRILLFLFIFSLSFSETLYLKEKLILTNNFTTANNLFYDFFELTNQVKFSSKFYKTHEIINICSLKDDFIVAGKGIEIKIVKPHSSEKIKDLIIANSEFELLDFHIPFNGLVYVDKITNFNSDGLLFSFVSLYYFTNEVGILTNIEVISRIKERSVDYYIDEINGREAKLYYKKGNINILMKVRILKKLENNYYLVENNNKVLKVRVKDE